MLPYGRQEILDDDIAAVVEALRSDLITQGPRVETFEARLAELVGAKYAIAYNSGTAALHAAYFAAGIAPGKSVLTTPITFAATANASLYLGGGVVFGDVDGQTIQLDPGGLEKSATPEVRVVAPVHFGGHVADVERIAGIASGRGWLVVEDAAHALGARYTSKEGREHRVGACAHSAMCCFSFHPVKHITTGEGGAVTTNDPKLARALRRFRTHGITRERSELRADDGPWYYEQQDLGFNYRITDFQCALGTAQLARLPAYVERRRALAAQYEAALGGVANVRPVAAPSWSRGSYHLYVVRVPAERRRKVFDALRADGFGVNVHYVPVYRHPYYRDHGWGTVIRAEADRYYAEAISLPMFPGMTDQDVPRVVASLKRHTAGG